MTSTSQVDVKDLLHELSGAARLESIELLSLRCERERPFPRSRPIELKQSVDASMIEQTNGGILEVAVSMDLVGRVRKGKSKDRVRDVMEVKALFLLKYSIASEREFAPEVLEAFAGLNAPLHCWPYWRELVHSMASRMGLPGLIIPLLTVKDLLGEADVE